MKAKPYEFGHFVPTIIDGARNGDIHGLALVRDTVGAVQHCIDGVGFTPKSRLCMLGGLGPILLEFMDPRYSNACTDPRGDALSGAIDMAKQLASNKRD
jgi:glucosamine kinase